MLIQLVSWSAFFEPDLRNVLRNVKSKLEKVHSFEQLLKVISRRKFLID